jgi:hypothetical protein
MNVAPDPEPSDAHQGGSAQEVTPIGDGKKKTTSCGGSSRTTREKALGAVSFAPQPATPDFMATSAEKHALRAVSNQPNDVWQ